MGLKRVMHIGLDAADPVHVKKLMDEGRMPNLKKLLENGAAHDNLAMLGALPSVTPPNWCSLATGCWPRTHGVTCYNNQTSGMPLDLHQANWDSGNVEAEFIWEAFTKAGKRSIMLNYCEAWPPRIEDDQYGVFIDGSGVAPFLKCNIDYQKMVVLEEGDFPIEFTPHVVKKDNKDCVVMGDQYEEMKKNSVEVDVSDFVYASPALEFPAYIEIADDPYMKNLKDTDLADKIHSPLKTPANWSFELPEGAKEATLLLAKSTIRRIAVFTASDGVHYDTITIYKNKKTPTPLGTVTGNGNWSDWIYDTYIKNDEERKVAYKIRMIDADPEGGKVYFHISHTTDISNDDFFYPKSLAGELYDAVGPMLQFSKVSDPAYPHMGDEVLFESYGVEQNKWQADATEWLFQRYPDWQLYYIHLHSIDNFQHWYINQTLPGSCDEPEYYADLIDRVYEENDKFIGRMMKYLDDDTTIFVTSDHGATPHSVGDDYPDIGSISAIATGVMEPLGYTKTYQDEETGMYKIDWTQTKAVASRSSYIYVNLKGREPHGIVEPEDYDQLVYDIISDLYNWRDPKTGKRVIAHCFTRDEMEYLGMGGDHCGDILFQLLPTFNCEHANVFPTVQHEGWSVNNLCIMGGAGIKKGELFRRPIRITDVVPTICHLVGVPMPADVEGGIIYQALEEKL